MDEGVSELLDGGFVLLLLHLYLLNLFLGQGLLLVQSAQLLILCCYFLLHFVDGFGEALHFLLGDAEELIFLVQIGLKLVYLARQVNISFPLFLDLLRDFGDLLLHFLEGLLFLEQQLQVGQIVALHLIPHTDLQVLEGQLDSLHEQLLAAVVEILEDIGEGDLHVGPVFLGADHCKFIMR